MILTRDLKWSPDGIQIEIITAGEYCATDLPARAHEIAIQLGIVSISSDEKKAEKPKSNRKSGVEK